MNLLPMLVQREIQRSGIPINQARWYLGIDLGTTNSTAVLVDAEAVRRGDIAEAVRLVPVRQITQAGPVESPLFASCVAETSRGRWEAGLGAKQALRQGGLTRGRQIFYSTKSDMGLGREPFYPSAASPEYDCPYKVAGRVLTELRKAVREDVGEDALANLVITIPASFQLAARKDTMRAASLAGLTLTERGLFDEPNAALLDYLFTIAHDQTDEQHLDFSIPRRVLVFDFGGGTCDISIVSVQVDAHEGRLNLANIAISRYERLGGDNIDIEIAEKILLPELLKQNQLNALDFTWAIKKNRILPQLVDIAEALKLGLCAEYVVQLGLHPRDQIKRDEIVATQPSVSVRVPQRGPDGKDYPREYVLVDPSLTLEQFETALEPFLDQELLYARDTEFNSFTSIIAPITDALQRASLRADEIDGVLLVGGSSLIPQVEYALQGFFHAARILRFPTADQTQFAVARGAALQSFFLHGFGKPLIRPIAQETIGLLTFGGGFFPLIRMGTELPFPADGSYASYDGLRVPSDWMSEITIVLAADSADKILGLEHLQFTTPPPAGAEVALHWRLDANKILNVIAWLPSMPDSVCDLNLENPLCSTRVQSGQHRRILELEQQVADAVASKVDLSETVISQKELARLYFGLGRFERAMDWARSAMRISGQRDVGMLQLLGRAYDRLGALDRSIKFCREAVEAEPHNSTLRFDLSLCFARQARLDEALTTVVEAMTMEPGEGIYVAHYADVLQKLGRKVESQASYRKAAQLLDESGLVYDYQLSWRAYVAQHLDEQDVLAEINRIRETKGRLQQIFNPFTLPEQKPAVVPSS